MVGTRLTYLLLLVLQLLPLLISSVAVEGSIIAQAHQVSEVETFTHAFESDPEYLLDDVSQLTVITRRSRLMRGRKLGYEAKGSGTVSKGSRSGNCRDHQGKGKLNVECALRKGGVPSSVNLVGHIPFSADYHTPKTHPPKNN